MIPLLLAVALVLPAPSPVRGDEPRIEAAKAERDQFCDELLAGHPLPAAVARWCLAVNHYFGNEWTHWALHIIDCESNGDPRAANPRSSARGLFQHLRRYWPGRAVKAGWPGASIFDPEANIAVSAWLFNDGRGRSHWKCKAAK